MAATDGPFPPAKLPRQVAQAFRYGFCLAWQKDYVVEDSVVDGQMSILARRVIRDFDIEVEQQITLPDNLVRWWVRVWHEKKLVLSAWCSKVGSSGETVGMVMTYIVDIGDGWQHHLRKHAEHEEKA